MRDDVKAVHGNSGVFLLSWTDKVKMEFRAFTRRQFLPLLASGIGSIGLPGYFHGSILDPEIPPSWGSAVSDKHIVRKTVSFKSGTDTVPALLAYPRARGRYPAVLVIHASWLVEPYIAETVAMLAQASFVGLALDLFHFFPHVSSWDEAQRTQGPEITHLIETEFREPRMVRNLQSGIDYLKTQPFTATGGVGVIGFCGGGWNALLFGAQSHDVGAVVAYYAPVGSSDIQHRAPLELAPYLHVPVQYHGARNDPNAPGADVDRLQTTLFAQGTNFERYTYESQHGFFAYDRDGIFNPKDAKLSWERSIKFLRRNIGHSVSNHQLAPPSTNNESSPVNAAGDHLMFHMH